MDFCQLQPGGEVLPGNTAADRDNAFDRQLVDMNFSERAPNRLEVLDDIESFSEDIQGEHHW